MVQRREKKCLSGFWCCATPHGTRQNGEVNAYRVWREGGGARLMSGYMFDVSFQALE